LSKDNREHRVPGVRGFIERTTERENLPAHFWRLGEQVSSSKAPAG